MAYWTPSLFRIKANCIFNAYCSAFTLHGNTPCQLTRLTYSPLLRACRAYITSNCLQNYQKDYRTSACHRQHAHKIKLSTILSKLKLKNTFIPLKNCKTIFTKKKNCLSFTPHGTAILKRTEWKQNRLYSGNSWRDTGISFHKLIKKYIKFLKIYLTLFALVTYDAMPVLNKKNSAFNTSSKWILLVFDFHDIFWYY